jgi:uncharacterized membrane protein YdjX (TVP38/TMEM64 family)
MSALEGGRSVSSLRMTDRRLWRGTALVIALAVAGFAIFLALRDHFNPAELARWARMFRDEWWAIPAYLLAYALLDILFIPTQALSIVAVLLWGWLKGGFIELLAATTGAVFPFLIARGVLRDSIAARLAQHQKAAAILESEGFTLLLILRVVPVIPYTILNYVAGLSSLRLWQYVAATILGMVPSTFIFAYFVESILEGIVAPWDVALRATGAGLLLAALIVLTRLAAPRVRRRLDSKDPAVSPTSAVRRD